jgi:hypothetical protein
VVPVGYFLPGSDQDNTMACVNRARAAAALVIVIDDPVSHYFDYDYEHENALRALLPMIVFV